jgi:hypothetical protein
MKLTTAQRKSQAKPQSWNKHINAFHQKLANKRLRRIAKKEISTLAP